VKKKKEKKIQYYYQIGILSKWQYQNTGFLLGYHLPKNHNMGHFGKWNALQKIFAHFILFTNFLLSFLFLFSPYYYQLRYNNRLNFQFKNPQIVFIHK